MSLAGDGMRMATNPVSAAQSDARVELVLGIQQKECMAEVLCISHLKEQ